MRGTRRTSTPPMMATSVIQTLGASGGRSWPAMTTSRERELPKPPHYAGSLDADAHVLWDEDVDAAHDGDGHDFGVPGFEAGTAQVDVDAAHHGHGGVGGGAEPVAVAVRAEHDGGAEPGAALLTGDVLLGDGREIAWRRPGDLVERPTGGSDRGAVRGDGAG